MYKAAWSFLLGGLIAVTAGQTAQAVPHRKALDHKSNQYLSHGVFIGGRSGRGFTLLDIRRFFDKKAQAERVVLDWGDHNARPLKGQIGFFHVGLDKNQKRLVVDLTQVSRAGLDEKQAIEKFKRSPLVKEVQLIFDPLAVSTQLILEFKTEIAAEVFYLVGEKASSRLVLDLRPLTNPSSSKENL